MEYMPFNWKDLQRYLPGLKEEMQAGFIKCNKIIYKNHRKGDF